MNLSTTYLGLHLRTPLVPSGSPLSHNLDNIKKMEDSGAAAVVLYSLFEEQIRHEHYDLYYNLTQSRDTSGEDESFFREPADLQISPDDYLRHISNAREVVDIPIIASLNGTTLGGWTNYARLAEQAGAHAIELNIYRIPTGINLTSSDVEASYLEILTAVKAVVTIPVAVKLSPFFGSSGF